MLRKILRLALLLCALAVMVSGALAVGGEGLNRVQGAVFFGGYLLMIPLGLLSGLAALLGGGPAWNHRLFQALVCKILLMQFFGFNFFLGAAGLFTGLIFGPLLLLPLLTALAGWMAVFGISGDVLRALWEMRREGVITSKQQLLHSVCQLIFVLDAVDAAVLCLGYAGNRRDGR